jgi:large subunit ribosomal protein L10
MNRAQKEEFVEGVQSAFSATSFVILADFKGCTVQQLDGLRRACEGAGSEFRVVKNSLCRIAVADSPKSSLAPHFRGNIGVIFSGDDPVATAKMIKAEIKSNAKIVLKAGFFEGVVLDEKGVEAVADLPSREELLAKLLGTLQEGPRQVLSVIQAAPRDLLYVLNNYAAKLEEGGV